MTKLFDFMSDQNFGQHLPKFWWFNDQKIGHSSGQNFGGSMTKKLVFAEMLVNQWPGI